MPRRSAPSPAGATLSKVLAGIDAAQEAGLAVKINMVALKGVNEDEIVADAGMGAWPRHGPDPDRDHADGRNRRGPHRPLSAAVAWCAPSWNAAYTLEDSDYRTGGPARYVRVAETGGRLGFITPLTHNFCESCNRVRLTCTGTLYMCLGQDDAADLRAPLRASPDDALLEAAIDEAIGRKPKGHDFVIDRAPARPPSARHMSMTGG